MSKTTFGTIIEKYRKKLNVSQKVVHEGIGSQASYRRGESDEREVDFVIQETILARLGQSATDFELILDDEEYDMWMERLAIRSATAGKDYDTVEKLVKEYRLRYAAVHKLHEQFCLYYELKLAEWHGEERKTLSALAAEALSLTKQIDDMPRLRESLYTPMELDLLLTLIQYRHEHWNNLFKNGNCLQKIIEYVNEYYSIERQEDIEGRAWLELLRVAEKYEDPEQLLVYIDKAIACFCGATGIERLGEVRFMKAQLLWRGYEDATDKEQQLHLCKEECKMAYCIFEVLRRTEKVREIEEFCLGELQWHITMQIE